MRLINAIFLFGNISATYKNQSIENGTQSYDHHTVTGDLKAEYTYHDQQESNNDKNSEFHISIAAFRSISEDNDSDCNISNNEKIKTEMEKEIKDYISHGKTTSEFLSNLATNYCNSEYKDTNENLTTEFGLFIK